MKKIFVYYNDGYYNDGGVGLGQFDHQEEAEAFILKRLNAGPERTLNNYIVIEGLQRLPRIAEVAMVIRLDDGKPTEHQGG
jgi:hypothetical protein